MCRGSTCRRGRNRGVLPCAAKLTTGNEPPVEPLLCCTAPPPPSPATMQVRVVLPADVLRPHCRTAPPFLPCCCAGPCRTARQRTTPTSLRSAAAICLPPAATAAARSAAREARGAARSSPWCTAMCRTACGCLRLGVGGRAGVGSAGGGVGIRRGPREPFLSWDCRQEAELLNSGTAWSPLEPEGESEPDNRGGSRRGGKPWLKGAVCCPGSMCNRGGRGGSVQWGERSSSLSHCRRCIPDAAWSSLIITYLWSTAGITPEPRWTEKEGWGKDCAGGGKPEQRYLRLEEEEEEARPRG